MKRCKGPVKKKGKKPPADVAVPPGGLADYLLAGSTECPLHEREWAAPTAKTRARAVLVTWSWSDRPDVTPPPKEKREVLRLIAGAIESIPKSDRAVNEEGSLDAKLGLLICSERHKSGKTHHHIVIDANCRVRWFAQLQPACRKMGICVDVRVPLVDRGASQTDRAVRYLQVPSEAKYAIDVAPLVTEHFAVNPTILREQKQELQKLRRKPASRDDLFEFLCAHPSVHALPQLNDLICRELEAAGGNIEALPFHRLRLWVSKEGRSAREEFAAQVARRNRLILKDLADQPFAYFVERASKSPCVCETPGQLLQSMIRATLYHDEKEVYAGSFKSSTEYIGAWYAHMVSGDFPDRRTALAITGGPGSGKSTLANCVFMVYGEERDIFVFKPNWDDTFVWDGYHDCVRVIDMNDMRITAHLGVSTALNVLERRRGAKLAMKNQCAAYLPLLQSHVPYAVISSNRLAPSGSWKEVELEALRDRVYRGGLTWAHPLPDSMRTNAVQSDCPRCAAGFGRWAMGQCGPVPVAAPGPRQGTASSAEPAIGGLAKEPCPVESSDDGGASGWEEVPPFGCEE
jgi:hypothetical protein